MNKSNQNKPSNRLTRLSFWFKTILIGCIIGLIIQFVKQGSVELPQLIQQLKNADKNWLSMGILLSVSFVILQGEMYVWSFRTVRENISRWAAIELYLKRNFVSVFLPLGSISSLATFNENIEKQGVTTLKMSIASSIYLVSGIVTLWVIALPILFLTAQSQSIDTVAYVSLLVLTLLLIALIIFLNNLKKRGKSYQLFARYLPKHIEQLDNFLTMSIDFKAFIMANWASLGLEIVGILMLFVAIYAIGFNIHWLIPCLAYTIATLILYVAPVARGVGAIELSLIYILTQNGIDANAALAVTLLARFFGFWLPLLFGGTIFLNR
ncbi:MAG: lysylphosphatidylglycerol synthase transmembrane domain-containing protein [Saprospiraceae bacterium]|nr:lysylphosphatidylglycerol synthase transmembrane domain-containing protein [Saprospiraceae bacterium]